MRQVPGNPVSAAVSGEKVTVKAEEAPEGKHLKNGDSATPQAGDSDAPQTGDETDALSAAALCALSLASAAAAVVLRFGKKKNRI